MPLYYSKQGVATLVATGDWEELWVGGLSDSPEIQLEILWPLQTVTHPVLCKAHPKTLPKTAYKYIYLPCLGPL